jgi:nucleotide-binding universal stress UspA family protein
MCQSTQGMAIHLAKENNAELIFLYVADPSFAGSIDDEKRAVLTDELAKLGEVLLHLAQKRASVHGVKAETVVHHGKVQERIESYLRESKASTLVIGSPEHSSNPNAFTSEELNRFASDIEQATGVRVVIAH